MIAIVDYQAGNLASVKKAFDHLGYESAITSEPAEVARASKIVLPGVGNFEATTALLGPLQDVVVKAIERQIPLLGICLGMQWMFESSREAPQLSGLGLFAGVCEKFPVAVSCADSPIGKEDWFGLTVILSNAGGPTVTDVLPLTP